MEVICTKLLWRVGNLLQEVAQLAVLCLQSVPTKPATSNNRNKCCDSHRQAACWLSRLSSCLPWIYHCQLSAGREAFITLLVSARYTSVILPAVLFKTSIHAVDFCCANVADINNYYVLCVIITCYYVVAPLHFSTVSFLLACAMSVHRSPQPSWFISAECQVADFHMFDPFPWGPFTTEVDVYLVWSFRYLATAVHQAVPSHDLRHHTVTIEWIFSLLRYWRSP